MQPNLPSTDRSSVSRSKNDSIQGNSQDYSKLSIPIHLIEELRDNIKNSERIHKLLAAQLGKFEGQLPLLSNRTRSTSRGSKILEIDF